MAAEPDHRTFEADATRKATGAEFLNVQSDGAHVPGPGLLHLVRSRGQRVLLAQAVRFPSLRVPQAHHDRELRVGSAARAVRGPGHRVARDLHEHGHEA